MTFEIEGVVHVVLDPITVSAKLNKREIIVDNGTVHHGSYYPNYLKFQCLNNHVGMLDGIGVGDRVHIAFTLSGTKNEKDGKVIYFLNLNISRIDVLPPTR